MNNGIQGNDQTEHKVIPWLSKVLLMDILLEVSWSKLTGYETHKEDETHN